MSSWRQLVYTSADFNDGGPGGWGVKLAVPPSFGAEAEGILLGVDTQLFLTEDLGDFPTAEKLEKRHRQLISRGGTDVLMIHSAAAGVDGTGRPGNVFVHAVSPIAGDLGGRAAIEYWQSPDWLVPYGPRAVVDSQLPAEIRPGPTITRSAVATFLSAPGNLDVLAVLLQATFPTGSELPTVIVLVDSPGTAALWIGAVTFVRDVRADHQLSWSTWARPESLTRLRDLGVRIIGVDRSQGEAARRWAENVQEAVVIDPLSSLHLKDGAWHCVDGEAVAPFGVESSTLASLKAAMEEFGSDVLLDILNDSQTLSLEASADFDDPTWALTASVLMDPDIDVADRREMTQSVLMFGPRLNRPNATASVIDDWWRADPEGAAGAMAGSDPLEIRDLLLSRRVVLLLAGAVPWMDSIDGRWPLEDPSRIASEVANAVLRLNALISSGEFADAAQMIRTFDTYGVGPSASELEDLRARLLVAVPESDRAQIRQSASATRPTAQAPTIQRTSETSPASSRSSASLASLPPDDVDVPVLEDAGPQPTNEPLPSAVIESAAAPTPPLIASIDPHAPSDASPTQVDDERPMPTQPLDRWLEHIRRRGLEPGLAARLVAECKGISSPNVACAIIANLPPDERGLVMAAAHDLAAALRNTPGIDQVTAKMMSELFGPLPSSRKSRRG